MQVFKQSGVRLINRYTIIISIMIIATIIIMNYTNNSQPPQNNIKIIRPVRTIKVEHKAAGRPLSLTGEILAKNEIDIAFRMDGKLVKRLVSVGDTVTPGQTVARIDQQEAEDNFTAAKSNLNAAQAALVQSINNEERQKILLSKGVIANAKYEDAITQLKSAQAKVEASTASLNQAQNRLGYTNLQVDVSGIVTSINAEAGEVVKAGQAIMRIATDEGRDAVFNVPEQLLQNKPSGNTSIEISLSHDPTIKTVGYVREISPQADSVTRTFAVKVGLDNPPQALKLGSTVTGCITLNKASAIELPVMSLNKFNSSPAVWVVNPEDNTVNLRNIKIIGYDQDSIIVSEGLQNGEIVVTAGVHSLYPGQQVKLQDK